MSKTENNADGTERRGTERTEKTEGRKTEANTLPAAAFEDSKHHIKIYQGDCLEILAQIPEGMVDLIFADPPYFLSNGGIRVRPALHHFNATSRLTTWLVNAHKDRIKAGDEVFFWEAGPQAGLVGWGAVQAEPVRIPLEEEELQFVLLKAKFDGLRLRVRIKVDGECYRSRDELRAIPALSNWAPIKRGVEGTNFRIPPGLPEELRLAIAK
jgi:hypothetical protein